MQGIVKGVRAAATGITLTATLNKIGAPVIQGMVKMAGKPFFNTVGTGIGRLGKKFGGHATVKNSKI